MRLVPAIFTSLAVFVGLSGTGFLYSLFVPRPAAVRIWVPAESAAGPAIVEAAAAQPAPPTLQRRVNEPTGNIGTRPRDATADGTTRDTLPAEQVDDVATASLTSDVDTAPASMIETPRRTAHVQWCLERYRSYRIDSNSYTAHSGESRTCVSPYTAGFSVSPEASRPRSETSGRSAAGSISPHVRSCLDRYRSYRPSDNSYQPYGGGPRRQCR